MDLSISAASDRIFPIYAEVDLGFSPHMGNTKLKFQ